MSALSRLPGRLAKHILIHPMAWLVEAGMGLILFGALLFIGGVVFIALQPLKGRLSRARRVGPARDGGTTLEPERPARGFSMRANWPGLAMIGLGALLMLVGTV